MSGTGAAGAGTAGTGAPAPGFAMCGKPPKEGVCKAKAPGVYALKTEVDVWFMDEYNPAPVFDAGRGKITIYFKGTINDICEDGSGGKAIMQPCGTRLPPLYADVNQGVIQIEFPDALWESPMIPKYMTTGSTSGFGVGDTLIVDKTAGLLGIELMDVNAAWPTYMQTVTFTCAGGKKGEACFPDHDGDGKPGITVKIKTDGTPPSPGYTNPNGPWRYIPAPVSLIGGAIDEGATTIYIGLRTRLGGSGKIGMDCASGVGGADADDFESRVLDCVMQDNMKCSTTGGEANGVGFLDKNTPSFHVLKMGQTPPANWKHTRPEVDSLLDRAPSKGPQSSVIRLGDIGANVSCADVRNANYPPFN